MSEKVTVIEGTVVLRWPLDDAPLSEVILEGDSEETDIASLIAGLAIGKRIRITLEVLE